MSEVSDTYADNFEAIGNAYGILLNMGLSAPVRTTYPEQPTPVARVRISWEMAKVLTFILVRMIKKTEAETGVSYPISMEMLNNLKIPKEDWDLVWKSSDIRGI